MTLAAEVTPIVLSFNEAPNIERTLEALRWANHVLLVDSGSDDGTQEIARRFTNVTMVERKFDNHAAQWNFGISHPSIATEWVLALDADYVLPTAFVDELAALQPGDQVSGYRAGFRYVISGTALRGSLYPPLVLLFRRARGTYREHGHRMVLDISGPIDSLRSSIDHDDRKDHARWYRSQQRYASLEAERLRGTPWNQLRRRDLVRRAVVLAPWLVPLYCIFVLGLWRDGSAGWRYVRERATAEWLIARELLR